MLFFCTGSLVLLYIRFIDWIGGNTGKVSCFSNQVHILNFELFYSTSLGSFLHVELSSESGALASPSPYDLQAELCEMRLSLLMEIEKRKQAEETLNNMQNQWESIRQRLYHVGIILPAGLIAVAEGDQPNSNSVEDLCEQIHVARFVSDAIGRGTARAEVEMEMEAQLDLKSFEIARLLERLRFYEMVNQEMSQRNQEAVGKTCLRWLACGVKACFFSL